MLNVVLSLNIIIITVAVLVRIIVVESNGILRMTRARLAVAA